MGDNKLYLLKGKNSKRIDLCYCSKFNNCVGMYLQYQYRNNYKNI